MYFVKSFSSNFVYILYVMIKKFRILHANQFMKMETFERISVEKSLTCSLINKRKAYEFKVKQVVL